MLEDKAKRCIEGYGLIERGMRVCAAVSGGADSITLLHYLNSIRGEMELTLSAAHVIHKIEGENPIPGAELARSLCAQYRIPLHEITIDVDSYAVRKRLSTETAARVVRYNFFESLSDKTDRIALAHNSDDRAETILMRLFRGSGIGLSGMEHMRGEYYIRPLLDVSRSEIDEYIIKHDLVFYEDTSNMNLRYDRNYLRHVVLPKIRDRWQGVVGAVNRASDLLRQDNAFIEKSVPHIEREGNCVRLPREILTLDPAVRARAVRRAFSLIKQSSDLEARHVDLLNAFYGASESGSSIQLPGGIVAYNDYGALTLEVFEIKESEESDAPSVTESIYNLGRFTVEITSVTRRYYEENIDKKMTEYGYRVLFADADTIRHCSVIRLRQEGDTFKPFKGGTKKLKDYFIDQKVLSRRRGYIPLIAKGAEVLAVCGFEISDAIKVTDDTKRIFCIRTAPIG